VKKQAIVCVDDEVIILLSLIQELKHAFGSNYLYEKATDADSALEIIEELEQEDVEVIFIISDWLMPGMTGDEFLKVVNEKYPHIKTIMITGHADQTAIDRVRKIDSVLAVFSKPWNPASLVAVIAKNATDT